jgi:2,5-dihydroxypyridine 5,6-dioxygenase
MAISDAQLFAAWKTVLQLCNLRQGEFVTLLASDDSHRQTLAAAHLAATELGGIVSTLTLPAMNGERSMSRDKTAFVGRTALAGNAPAMACLKNSNLVIDLMLLLLSRAGRNPCRRHAHAACGRAAGGAGAPSADAG